MPIVKTRLGEVAYSLSGNGQAVVLLHANPGDRRDWDGVVERLAQRHTLVALDWPGYGESLAQSPPSSATALGFAELLLEVLDALALGPAFLIGNSVGGYAALHVALNRPELVQGVVLVDSAGFTLHTWLTRAFTRLKGTEWFTRKVAGQFARRYLVRRTVWTRAMIERADAETQNAVQVAVDAAVWRSFLDPALDMRARAATIRAPIMLVWGRRDPNVRLSRDGAVARSVLPTSPFVVLDTGHAPQAEDPDAFLDAVEPFLREHAKPSQQKQDITRSG